MFAATVRLFSTWLLLATFCEVAAGAPHPGPDSLATSDAPNALIERVIQEYGGRAALDRVQAYRAEGNVVAAIQGRKGPTVRLFARPNRLRVEIHYPDAPETRIAIGSLGWRGKGSSIQPATGPMLDAMLLQAARAAVPWILADRAGEARSTAPRQENGHLLQGVEIAIADSLMLRVWVDPSSGRVVHSQGALERGPMHTTFETSYSDFRTVDGVLFPFREENFAGGQPTGTTTFEKVIWNPPVHDADFGP